jgi:hypothetical protein
LAERSLSNHIFDSSGKIDSTGSANAYVITISEQVNGYSQGMAPIRFKANFTNSGSATANIVTQTAPSGLGPVTLKKNGGATDLASGDIVSGGVYTLIHDATNFQVQELNGTVAAGSVGTTQLADDAVTNAKLANMAEATIKGRAVGAGTGDPTDLTATQATAILNAFTDALKGLAPASGGGTANFLRADGSWAIPSSGLVLLTSGTVSAAAALDIVLTSYTAYRGFKVFASLLPATEPSALNLRFSTNGGSSYDAGATDYAYMEHFGAATGAHDQVESTGAAQISITGNVGGGTREGIVFESTLIDPFSTARDTKIFTASVLRTDAALAVHSESYGIRNAAQDTDAIRYLFSGGNISAGSYALYGIL